MSAGTWRELWRAGSPMSPDAYDDGLVEDSGFVELVEKARDVRRRVSVLRGEREPARRGARVMIGARVVSVRDVAVDVLRQTGEELAAREIGQK